MDIRFLRRARILLVACVLAGCAGAPPGSDRVAAVATPSAIVSPAVDPTPSVGVGEPWLVYQGGTGGPARIRLVRPDGTADHELVPDQAPGEQLHPDWSPDGARIAFAVDPGDGMRDIWVADVGGERAERVFDCLAPCAWADDPAWAPDGRSLLVQVAREVEAVGTGVSELLVLDLGTGDVRTVFTAPPTEYLYVPRWAPDGTAIVVEDVRFGSALLAEERVVAGTVGIVDLTAPPTFVPILDWESGASYPDWSPDGGWIVFQRPTSAGSDAADIHVIRLDGTDERAVTDFGSDGGWAIQPTWTPDGRRIVFVGEDMVRTQPNAAFVGADGATLERLPWDGTSRTHPRLRPLPGD